MIFTVLLEGIYKAATMLSVLMTVCTILVMTEVNVMLRRVNRSASFLCIFCQVRPVTQIQHLVVCVISAT